MHLPEDDEPTDPIPARKVNEAITAEAEEAEAEEASTDEIPAKTVTTLIAKGPKPKEDRTDPDLHSATIDFAPRDEHDPDETLRISARKR